MPTNFDIKKYCNNERQYSKMSFTKKATQTNNARSKKKMRFAQRARLMALYR